MRATRRLVWPNKGVTERQKLTCIKIKYHCRNSDSRRYLSQSDDLSHRRRVVCSGIGVVSPLGCGVENTWQKLVNSECGITAIESKAAFVPVGEEDGKFNEKSVASSSERRNLLKSSTFALAAAEDALRNANWKPNETEELERTGVAVGNSLTGLEEICKTGQAFFGKGYKRVGPYFIPKILTNLPSGHISIRYGFKGPNHSVSTACTTGAHAIGDAFSMIRSGYADVMVCGGTDASISPLACAGFCRARALSRNFNDDPQRASRPFDKDRDGFVMGEGAAVLILEERNHAINRNAKMYAEVLGYGLSGDAHHITAPSEDGRGAFLAMKSALRDACLTPKDVCYINAHATSTPLGDAVENKAIKDVFLSHANNLQVSSTKGAVGHLLGAAGAIEAAFTMLAISKEIVPPTLNLHSVSSHGEFSLNYVPLKAQELSFEKGARKVALSNSFGFGGTNATLCFGEIV